MSQQTHSAPPPPAGGSGYQTARNGLGVAALILGIIGAISGLIPVMFWLAGILGVIALILGLVGRGRAKRGQATNKGMTTTGAVLGLASLILSVVGIVITMQAVGDAVNEINKAVEDTSVAGKGDGKEGRSAKTYAAGDTVIYDDGIEVTVSKASAYTPSEYAAGHTEGNKAYKVTVRIENKGKKTFDPLLTTLDARAGKDGKTAEEIFDDTIGGGFESSILPGKAASTDFAFDVPADADSFTIEVSTGEHDPVQWEIKF